MCVIIELLSERKKKMSEYDVFHLVNEKRFNSCSVANLSIDKCLNLSARLDNAMQ